MLTSRTHPMVLIAAVAVTIFSIIGVAAITGWIPSAHSERMDEIQNTTPDGQVATLAPRVANSLPATVAAGSNHPAPNNPSHAHDVKQVACNNCGVVESIRLVHHEGRSSGLGAVAGGITGGLVGNQIGRGKGNALMTIIGAGGGILAGNAIEKNMKSTSAYVSKIRMQDGTYRSVTQTSQPKYAIGDRVKMVSGHVAVV
ncbi:MAG TPA: glycine zipper 2TM domain-containing protein [Methylophilaceae bacterium]